MLLTSTTIEEWDKNYQRNDRQKTLKQKLQNEIDIVSQEDQWLEKYNQLIEFYQKQGHTQVNHSNSADKSLVYWVGTQRKSCNNEKRRKMLNSIGFVFSASKERDRHKTLKQNEMNIVAHEDRWLEKYN